MLVNLRRFQTFGGFVTSLHSMYVCVCICFVYICVCACVLVICITKTFHVTDHITAPHIHDMNIYHSMTSQTSYTLLTCKLHATHNEGAGKQVIIINCIWLICILASCLMLRDHNNNYNNSDSSETITIYDHLSFEI